MKVPLDERKYYLQCMCSQTSNCAFINVLCVFSKVALQRSSGMDETGVIVWYLALCLLLAWLIVGAALFKGIKSSGKVIWESQATLK